MASQPYRNAVAQRQPFVFGPPLPRDGLPFAVVTKLNTGAFRLATNRPHVAIDGHVVVPVEAVVLECAREVAARVVVPSHDAQSVERAVDLRTLILDQEEFASVPTSAVRAGPLRWICARIFRILLGATEGLPFGLPFAKKAVECVVL